jgi:hypothetical protein
VRLDVAVLPGSFVHPATPLAWVDAAMEPQARDEVRAGTRSPAPITAIAVP